MDIIKKYFWLISASAVFCFGTVLALSYEVSGHTAWSIIVSSVNSSAWECLKPFALVNIFWIFIELSYLRPSLLRFVSSRILFLDIFVISTFLILRFFELDTIRYYVILLLLVTAMFLSYKLYDSKMRCDLFFIPLIISFVILFFMLLIFSVRPPLWVLP